MPTDETVVTVHDLKPHQWELIKARNKYVIIDGGVGTYKTTACIYKLLFHCMAFRNMVIIVAAQTYQQLLDVFLSQWKIHVPENYYVLNRQEHTITLPRYGSIIMMRYADHPKAEEVIKGTNATGFYLVQGENLSDIKFFDRLDQRVRVGNPKRFIKLIDCNPGSPGHFIHERFIDKGNDHHLGSDVTHIRVPTTPETSSHTQEQIDMWERIWSPEMFARDIRGEWTVGRGAVYKHWTVVPDITPDQLAKYWIGFDPGHSQHQFGLVWIGMLQDGTYVIFDEIKGKLVDRGMDRVAEMIKVKNTLWGEDKYGYMMIDWSDNVYRTSLKKFYNALSGVYYPHAKRKYFEVEQGVALVEQALRLGLLKICKKCSELVVELNSYKRKDDGTIDKKGYDAHLLDATRYCWIRLISYVLPTNVYEMLMNKDTG